MIYARFSPIYSVCIGDDVKLGTIWIGDNAYQLAPPTIPYSNLAPTWDTSWENDEPGNLPHFYNGKVSFGDSVEDDSYNINWIKVSDKILVCDRVLFSGNRYSALISYQDDVEIDGNKYTWRVPTSKDWNCLVSATSGFNSLMHWEKVFSYINPGFDSEYVYASGFSSATKSVLFAQGGDTSQYIISGYYYSGKAVGFRPALELIE